MRIARTFVLGVALATLPVMTLGCGDKPPPAAPKREAQPAWQDVFDGTPEIYVVVRPQLMKHDAVYGNFFSVLMRVARARSGLSSTTLEALDGCDEFVFGVSKREGADDAVFVVRGVPASMDAQKLTDGSGHSLFRLVDSRAKVPELESLDRRTVGGGALFVLPDRTWVVTAGDARARARQAFASPFGRPAPKADPEALASIRVDASVLARRGVGPNLAVLTKKLTALSLVLEKGKGGLVIALQYADEDATAWAEMQVKRIIAERASADPAAAPPPPAGPRRPTTAPQGPARLDWLKEAVVTREGNSVRVRVPVPARLLEELPGVTGGDVAW